MPESKLNPEFPKSPYDIIAPALRNYPEPPPLVPEIRRHVQAWRDEGYKGATDTSIALLHWWFDTPEREFQYYFAQREAVETIVYLVDVVKVKDSRELVRFDGSGKLTASHFKEHWNRLVVKMATGTGKTKVMSLVIAWSFFHKLYEQDSELSRNFLVIAPNIIVLDRLYGDFRGLQIFFDDPVLPDNGYYGRNWRNDFQVTVHRQDDVRVSGAVGNIFLTNIHRVYRRDEAPPSLDDSNTIDYFLLDKRPTGKTTDSKLDLRDVVHDIDELMVLNDEAHHIHDPKLEWYKSIEDIHNRFLQKGGALSLQVDVTATPKHSDGAFFAQIVSDYPLLEAITQNVVKRPTIPDALSRKKLVEKSSAKYTEKYADYLNLGVQEWLKTSETHEKAAKKAILFVMTDDTRNCDEVAKYLEGRCPELRGAVLVIHTKQNGEISEAATGKKKAELDILRTQAHEIDSPDSPYKAIVSVLMLKEGWDVKNVTTIVGLRAYESRGKILAEQTIGRGLRLMYPDRVEERVSVIGTDALMNFIRDELEKEGVIPDEEPMGDDGDDIAPLMIEIDRGNPAKNIDELEIEIPILWRRFHRVDADLNLLGDGLEFQPTIYYEFTDAEIQEQVNVRFEDMVTGEGTHETDFNRRDFPTDISDIIRGLALDIMEAVGYFMQFDVLYGKIEDFVKGRLFGEEVALDTPQTWRNLAEESTKTIVRECFIKAINDLAIKEQKPTEVDGYNKLSQTRPFPVPRTDCFRPRKSLFNWITGDSNSRLELEFAGFLDSCSDVFAYAKNYKENREAAFRLDYVNYQGRISDYYPDFIVKLTDGRIVIVETKGQRFVDENVPLKRHRLTEWCRDVNAIAQGVTYDSVYVDYAQFQDYQHTHSTFQALVGLKQQKGE